MQATSPLKGTLSIVATPIGNLGDFSARAAATLSAADIIACEDTRVTRRLLRLTSTTTKAKLISYHDYNGAKVRPQIIEHLREGKMVVLVSDAGTPLISDPGYKLVAECRNIGIRVISIPGPTAAISALTVSGLPSERFLFAGFVPSGKSARQNAIKDFADLKVTTIWFETPTRLNKTLREMSAIMGDRRATVARELTKFHEEAFHGTILELVERLSNQPPLKGELVVIVEGNKQLKNDVSDDNLMEIIRSELDGRRLREAVESVVETTGLPRKQVYKLALTISADQTKNIKT